jgi:hypothetical protein
MAVNDTKLSRADLEAELRTLQVALAEHRRLVRVLTDALHNSLYGCTIEQFGEQVSALKEGERHG